MQQKPLLKQGFSLKPDDFSRYPVWVQCHLVDYDEPWYEETDEETFRPWDKGLPVNPGRAMYLIRATLVLANDARLSGFVTPQPAEEVFDLGRMQPCMFSPSGELLHFWDGACKRPEKARRRFYASLGLDAKEIFPVAYSAEPGLALGRVAGSIPSLCWLRDFKELEFYT